MMDRFRIIVKNCHAYTRYSTKFEGHSSPMVALVGLCNE